MLARDILKDWVIEALRAHGGKATVFQVSKYIWDQHESELRQSDRLLYTWQYEMRWAAQKLRHSGRMKAVHGSRSRPWELADRTGAEGRTE